MKIFLYDNVNSTVILNKEEILLVKEFAALVDPKRFKIAGKKIVKDKEHVFKEFTYMFLFFD